MNNAPSYVRPIVDLIKSREVSAAEFCTGQRFVVRTIEPQEAKPARIVRGHRARRAFGKRNAR